MAFSSRENKPATTGPGQRRNTICSPADLLDQVHDCCVDEPHGPPDPRPRRLRIGGGGRSASRPRRRTTWRSPPSHGSACRRSTECCAPTTTHTSASGSQRKPGGAETLGLTACRGVSVDQCDDVAADDLGEGTI